MSTCLSLFEWPSHLIKLLYPRLPRVVQEKDPRIIFQQENARPHTARLPMAYLIFITTLCLPWPARSPDLSPIEHLWEELGRRVHDPNIYFLPPGTLQELTERVHREWYLKQSYRSSSPVRGHEWRNVLRKYGRYARYFEGEFYVHAGDFLTRSIILGLKFSTTETKNNMLAERHPGFAAQTVQRTIEWVSKYKYLRVFSNHSLLQIHYMN